MSMDSRRCRKTAFPEVHREYECPFPLPVPVCHLLLRIHPLPRLPAGSAMHRAVWVYGQSAQEFLLFLLSSVQLPRRIGDGCDRRCGWCHGAAKFLVGGFGSYFLYPIVYLFRILN